MGALSQLADEADKFLIRKLDLSSVETLNAQFTAWVEEHYNAHEHGTLQMKPIDRFGLDLSASAFLPPNEVNDELFWVEQGRAHLYPRWTGAV